jgi:hypothetical protein
MDFRVLPSYVASGCDMSAVMAMPIVSPNSLHIKIGFDLIHKLSVADQNLNFDEWNFDIWMLGFFLFGHNLDF